QAGLRGALAARPAAHEHHLVVETCHVRSSRLSTRKFGRSDGLVQKVTLECHSNIKRRRFLNGNWRGPGQSPPTLPGAGPPSRPTIVGQLRQDIGVDFTRAKERLVLSEAETSEPTPDIHGRTPRARPDHP